MKSRTRRRQKSLVKETVFFHSLCRLWFLDQYFEFLESFPTLVLLLSPYTVPVETR